MTMAANHHAMRA